MTQTPYADFVLAYIQEVRKMRPEFSPAQALEKVKIMLASINKGTHEDWLKYNPAMKSAAAQVGIKKSSDLREFVKAHYTEAQEPEYPKVQGEGAPQYTFAPADDQQLALL